MLAGTLIPELDSSSITIEMMWEDFVEILRSLKTQADIDQHESSIQTQKIFIVRFMLKDTDFQGVVYHANYLKYFERALDHSF